MTEEDFKLKKIANRFIRRNGIDKEYDDCVSELIIKTFITAYKLAKHRQKTDLHLQLTEKDKQIENACLVIIALDLVFVKMKKELALTQMNLIQTRK